MATSWGFKGTNPAAQRAAARLAAALVKGISEETRAALRALIVRSIREGIPPYDAARMIRSMVGLTEKQAQAAMSYRQALIDSGHTMDRVEKLVERYSDRKVRERAKTIARTEIMGALNEGSRQTWKQAQADGLLGDDAKKEWRTRPDEKTCPLCGPLDGLQVPLNEDFDTPEGPLPGPPLHPNCLPGDALVSACGRIAATSERRYDGDLLVIHTARGFDLACSPNHPVLTPSGWLPAQALHVGGYVVSSRFREWKSARRNVDHEDMPTRFHEIAEAARRSEQMASAPVPLTAEDFHGDGLGSKVAVVWTYRALRDGANATGPEQLSQAPLGLRGVEYPRLPSLSSPGRHVRGVALAAPCPMCGRHLSRSRQGRHSRPLERLGFGLATNQDAVFSKPAIDGGPGDAELARKLIDGSAGSVSADKVIAVEHLSFHGLLFNAETSTGAYWANGILTHNCRCSMRAIP